MGETVTVRLPKRTAIENGGAWVREYLAGKGLNVRTMTGRSDGDELVYEGERVTKGNSVTNGNCGGGNEEN